MISIYNLKSKFQEILTPILVLLRKWRVSANQITISSILLSVLIGLGFWFADLHRFLFLVLPIGLLLRMGLNALDGMMARTYNQQTKKGEILNELGDVVSDFLIYLPLVKYEIDSLYMVITFICLSIINEMSGVIGKVISGQRQYAGPMGKSDRAFVIGIYGLISYFSISISKYSFWIFLGLNLLLLLSTYTRCKKSLV